MFRWKKHDSVIRVLAVLGLSVAGGLWISSLGPAPKNDTADVRKPAATAIQNFTPEQIAQAEWSVSSLDFESSDPGRGRSYFDSVFSEVRDGKRVYNVPYPFQKAMDRINQYLGYGGQTDADNAVRSVLFPMGRSLQRNAALLGSAKYDINLFFRFPRVVVGVDREPKDASNPLALNLKGRLFLGFHEKSKVIEAISYNDQEGRYEYQVVRDYEPGKKPQVVYANRQLCLSCHQNQTPIYSVGPWNETNAHLPIFSVIEKQMTGAFGDVACDGTHTQPYCFNSSASGKRYQYFGAPTRVDLSVPYALDTLTDKANYFHAFQKMWLNLCNGDDCRKKITKLILTYILNDREGLYLPGVEKENALMAFEARFQQRFPNGLKIPEANLPNRDPLQDRLKTAAEVENSMKSIDGVIHAGLQDLISRSAVSGQVEPLMVRPPAEIWKSSEPDFERNTNKMIVGFANYFSALDARSIDAWLSKHVGSGKVQLGLLKGTCEIQKSAATGDMEVQVICNPKDKAGLAMENGYFPIRAGQVQGGLVTNLFLYGADSKCDWQAIQSTENRANGIACPAILNAEALGSVKGDVLTLQLYHAKSGLNARLIDGRLIAKVEINLTSGQMQVSIADDVALLDGVAVGKADAPFNRTAVMKSVAEILAAKVGDPDAGLAGLEKNLESDVYTADQILATYKNPVNAFVHSCGMCHHNFEGVPPAFLGLKSASVDLVGKCQRIEVCAPRMLYRLKMRNCAPDQIAKLKKNPMPIPNFFKSTGVNVDTWQKTVAPQLISFATKLIRPAEIVSYMVSQGVDAKVAQTTVTELTQSNCPNVDYTVYDNLPRCDFEKLKADSSCSSLMTAFGNN